MFIKCGWLFLSLFCFLFVSLLFFCQRLCLVGELHYLHKNKFFIQSFSGIISPSD